jgi:hypothetical protein
MKQRITIDDLNELSEDKKSAIRSLWTPQKYDVAFTPICVNAETDEFEKFEFVVGDIVLEGYKNGEIFSVVENPEMEFEKMQVRLKPMMPNNSDTEVGQYDEKEDSDKSEQIEKIEKEKSFTDDELDEIIEEFDYLQDIDSVLLNDCLPLLTIGQLIEILRKVKSGIEGFQITVPQSEEVLKYSENDKFTVCCEGLDKYENIDLCDALWILIKDLL